MTIKRAKVLLNSLYFCLNAENCKQIAAIALLLSYQINTKNEVNALNRAKNIVWC